MRVIMNEAFFNTIKMYSTNKFISPPEIANTRVVD